MKNQFNYFERVDILSQTLRLIILHQNQLKLKKDNIKIIKLIQNILNYQKLGVKNIKTKGGFFWGKKVMEKNFTCKYLGNSICNSKSINLN